VHVRARLYNHRARRAVAGLLCLLLGRPANAFLFGRTPQPLSYCSAIVLPTAFPWKRKCVLGWHNRAGAGLEGASESPQMSAEGAPSSAHASRGAAAAPPGPATEAAIDSDAEGRWRYSLDELRASPSVVRGGISYEDEQMFRRVECEYMTTTGWKLFKRRETVAEALYLFHRFYARQSMHEPQNDRTLVSSACLLLASKIGDVLRTQLFHIVEAHLVRGGHPGGVAKDKLERTEARGTT
jgi:hypothetical protein